MKAHPIVFGGSRHRPFSLFAVMLLASAGCVRHEVGQNNKATVIGPDEEQRGAKMSTEDRGMQPMSIGKCSPSVVIEAGKVLRGPPESWLVEDINDYIEKGNLIVRMSDTNGSCVSSLVQSNQWFVLNNAATFTGLNLALKADLVDSGRLEDQHTAGVFLQHVINLYEGPRRHPMTIEFRNDIDRNPAVWMDGKIHNLEDLRKLCHEISIIREYDKILLMSNVFTIFGSVEEWSVTLRLGTPMSIEKISVKPVYEVGSFGYGYVG